MKTIPQDEAIQEAAEPEALLQARIPEGLIKSLRKEAIDRGCAARDIVQEILEERYHEQVIGKGKAKQQGTK